MSETEPEAQERKAREAAFHDRRYRQEIRRGLDPLYAATGRSRACFQAVLDQIPPGAKVLELGCGVKADSLRLGDRGCLCTAVDVSVEAIRRLQRQADDRGVTVQAIVGDAEHLDLPARSFDWVVGRGILHHLSIDAVAGELDRLLGPSGRAAFLEPLGVNPALRHFRRRTPQLRSPDEHPLLPADVEALRRRGRFTATCHHFSLLEPALALVAWHRPQLPVASLALRAAGAIDQAILSRRSPLRWLSWMAVVELQRTGSSPSIGGGRRG